MSISSSSTKSFQIRMWKWAQRYCPWVLQGIGIVYGGIGKVRRKAYQHGWLRQQHLSKPVVSIGNMTVGGTGKTPMVIWIAQHLHAKGKRVAILSRGYGRKNPSNNLMVSDGQGHVETWRISGDEPVMMAQRCPWAVVAVGPDRFQLGQWVLEQRTCDCFLLDDGYQHLSLYRDLDVVLFDATDIRGLDGVMPAGRLREPLRAAKGLGAMVITRAKSLSDSQSVQRYIEESLSESIHPIVVNMVPKELRHLVTGEVQTLKFLSKISILAVSGIGNPRAFRDMVLDMGLTIEEEIHFSDHCSYKRSDVNLIRKTMDQSNSKIVLTTEKDAIKLREWFTPEDPIWFVRTEVEFLDGERQILERLEEAGAV